MFPGRPLRVRKRVCRQRRRRSCAPPLGEWAHAINADDLLLLQAQSQFGGIEDPIDDIEAASQPVVDEFGLPASADDEKWRRFASAQSRWELDIGLGAVIKCADRTPRRPTAAESKNKKQH